VAQTVCIILGAPNRKRLTAIVSDRNRQRKHIERAQVILASAERGLLWSWRHEARKRGAIGAPTFVPLRILAEHAATPVPSTAAESEAGAAPATSGKPEDGQAGAAPGSIEIEHRGVLVRVNGLVDAPALREILLYLGRRS
jgi:hypothetical protein